MFKLDEIHEIIMKKNKILGIVVARGGSKSIPRKNVKILAGKPLIVWSIDAGIRSGILDRLIVSTDDQEIAEISKKAGAEIPFIRPSELAQDTTPTLPVLQHAVSFLREQEGYMPDYVLLLEPTSPCRQSFHLQEAAIIVEETGADSIVALGEVPKHFSPEWQFNIEEDKKIALFTGGHINNVICRRQNLPTTYFRNGAFYLFKTDLLFEKDPSLYGEDVRGYVIENKYSVDIDTPEDWEKAEEKLQNL
jgi:CMP-N,N'-diacetyllegionaminic acid synthase